MATKKKQCVAGHDASSNCSNCGLHCCNITPERGREIAESARSGAHRGDFSHSGPACECGLRLSTVCHRHPWKK